MGAEGITSTDVPMSLIALIPYLHLQNSIAREELKASRFGDDLIWSWNLWVGRSAPEIRFGFSKMLHPVSSIVTKLIRSFFQFIVLLTCKACRFWAIHLLKESKETIEGLSISTVILGTIDVGVGWKETVYCCSQ